MTSEQHAVWFYTYQTVLTRVVGITNSHPEAIQQAVDAANCAVGLYPNAASTLAVETQEAIKRGPGRPKKEQ